ncbi:TonB-dependent receptor [Flavobacterium pallidum]|uniref:TonB-dependent receptor n=1 Tax=Flavobacterium pallidum TaxID=2172098 RepID=A0A2S1SFG2_9FLAO|nr:TonB-dependent receptor [Flavobacterium pallidum]AWI25148.1 TonB-dependent receptor [Flavobacterium pallidum]
MKKILLALLLGSPLLNFAQNKLSGVVTDSINQPLKGVSVFLPDVHKSAITNESGVYTLNNLPSGNVKISFSFVGYNTENKSVLLNPGENLLNITLLQSEFKMDEVVVSTVFNKLQSQNVMKVEHSNVRQLQHKGAVTLVEGIATIPGVSQISTGTSIGKPVIRGLSGNRVLVYSQGVRLENQQFGDEHGLGLNDSGVESVEVIKGPASLLYGSDALGGVLYFNPEKFAAANAFKADFGQRFFSNTLGSSTTLGLKTSTENLKFLARGNYTTQSDYAVPNGDKVTNTRYNEKDFKTGIGFSNDNYSGVLRYNFNALSLGIPEDGIAEQTNSKTPDYPRQSVYNHLLSLNNTLFFGNSKLDLDLGYISNTRNEFEENATPDLKMQLNTFNYDAKYHLPKTGKWESILGIQGMHQSNTNKASEFLIPDAVTNDIGFFGTTNYEWKSNVIQAGLRYDNRKISSDAHGITGTEGSFEAVHRSFDSFNAALGYKTNFGKPVTLRLNVASGFRAPNLAELASNGVHEGTNRYEIGNSDLKTEQNLQTDLNLEYNNDHFEFFVNGFYNFVNHYIFTSPTAEQIDGYDVFRYVQDDAALYGGEIGLHIHPHPLDWLHYETSFEMVNGKRKDGDYLPLIPANNWNNTLRGEFNLKNFADGYASLNVSHTFNQSHVGTFETESDGYTLVNLALGGKVIFGKTAFDISLNGNNIFDEKYIAHLSRLKTDGIPNIGRNIILGVNFNL